MATDVSVQILSDVTATAPTAITADATGNTFTPPDNTEIFARFMNGSGASITVTVDDPNSVTPTGATAWDPDAAIVVGAGVDRMVKIGDPARFTAGATGKVTFTYSDVTSFTFELYT